MLKPIIVAELPYTDRREHHVQRYEAERRVRLPGNDQMVYLPLEKGLGGRFVYPKGFGWLRQESPKLLLLAHEVGLEPEPHKRRKSKDYPIQRGAQVVCEVDTGSPLQCVGRGIHGNQEARFAFLHPRELMVVHCAIKGNDIAVKMAAFRLLGYRIEQSDYVLIGRRGREFAEQLSGVIHATRHRLHCGYDKRTPRERADDYRWVQPHMKYEWSPYPRADPWNGGIGPNAEPCRCERPHYGTLVG